VKIDTIKIPYEGLTLEEDLRARALALEQEGARFPQPVKVRAEIYKITNAVTVDLSIAAAVYFDCSRCLNEFKLDFKRELRLNYPVERVNQVIDLDEDIRQEIILALPLKPLCLKDCRGLCPKCGVNLNNEKCECGIV